LSYAPKDFRSLNEELRNALITIAIRIRKFLNSEFPFLTFFSVCASSAFARLGNICSARSSETRPSRLRSCDNSGRRTPCIGARPTLVFDPSWPFAETPSFTETAGRTRRDPTPRKTSRL